MTGACSVSVSRHPSVFSCFSHSRVGIHLPARAHVCASSERNALRITGRNVVLSFSWKDQPFALDLLGAHAKLGRPQSRVRAGSCDLYQCLLWSCHNISNGNQAFSCGTDRICARFNPNLYFCCVLLKYFIWVIDCGDSHVGTDSKKSAFIYFNVFVSSLRHSWSDS